MDRGMEGGRKKGRTGLDEGEFAPGSWGWTLLKRHTRQRRNIHNEDNFISGNDRAGHITRIIVISISLSLFFYLLTSIVLQQ